MPGLLLRDRRPWRAGGPADLLIRDGVVVELGPGLDPGDAEVLDLGGRLGPAPADRIADERVRRAELGLPGPARVTALLETMAAAGTTTSATCGAPSAAVTSSSGRCTWPTAARDLVLKAGHVVTRSAALSPPPAR
jgi:hypothetical protein